MAEEVGRLRSLELRREESVPDSAGLQAKVRWVATLVLLACAGLVAWQVLADADPDVTTLGALVGATVALLAITFPRVAIGLANDVSNFEALGIKVELKVEEVAELGPFPAEEGQPSLVPPPWPKSNQAAFKLIADELRRRLRFTSTVISLRRGKDIPVELIVENLGNEGLLPWSEIVLCRDLLGSFYKQAGELDRERRDEYLEGAWAFTVRLPSRLFDRHARRTLSAGGWRIADFEQDGRHRPEFIGAREDGRLGLIAARVAEPRKSVVETAERIAEPEFPLTGLRPIVVIPDGVDNQPAAMEDGPMQVGNAVLIVRLKHLIAEPGLVGTDRAGLEAYGDD